MKYAYRISGKSSAIVIRVIHVRYSRHTLLESRSLEAVEMRNRGIVDCRCGRRVGELHMGVERRDLEALRNLPLSCTGINLSFEDVELRHASPNRLVEKSISVLNPEGATC